MNWLPGGLVVARADCRFGKYFAGPLVERARWLS
jgi:hypothetical protein